MRRGWSLEIVKIEPGCGGWSHSSWEEGVGINRGGETVEQVGREEQDLLSEKVNVRCLWSATWKWKWEGSCWVGESGFRHKVLAGSLKLSSSACGGNLSHESLRK